MYSKRLHQSAPSVPLVCLVDKLKAKSQEDLKHYSGSADPYSSPASPYLSSLSPMGSPYYGQYASPYGYYGSGYALSPYYPSYYYASSLPPVYPMYGPSGTASVYGEGSPLSVYSGGSSGVPMSMYHHQAGLSSGAPRTQRPKSTYGVSFASPRSQYSAALGSVYGGPSRSDALSGRHGLSRPRSPLIKLEPSPHNISNVAYEQVNPFARYVPKECASMAHHGRAVAPIETGAGGLIDAIHGRPLPKLKKPILEEDGISVV